MTITYKDGFALIPKRCDKCHRLFWLEPYSVYYKEVGIEHYSLKQIKCKNHSESKGENGKMNIGDLWRRKTDEELANSLLNIVSNGKCPAGRYKGDDDCVTMKRCYDCWLNWLKQEVESDG